MNPIDSILVPTDFSECCLPAIDLGVEMARTFGAEIVLLHVLAPPGYSTTVAGKAEDFEKLEASVRASCEQDLAELQSRLLADNVPCETVVEQGAPHEEILRVAGEREIDMIVIGTHGHTGFKHFLLGSTAEKVVRRSSCPVLTVRGAQQD